MSEWPKVIASFIHGEYITFKTHSFSFKKASASICLFFLLASSFLLAEKTDRVVLGNGSIIIGQIKKLDRDKLEYSTDDMKRVYIDWGQIYRITSKDLFRIELEDGRAYFGSIQEGSEDKKMVIVGHETTGIALLDKEKAKTEVRLEVDLLSVIHITPMETKFYDRLKGYLKAGFGYQKANKLTTLSLGADLTYYTRKREMNLAANYYYSNQEEAESTRRLNLSLSEKRFLPKKWVGNMIGRAEQNKELNLDLRAQLTVGVGNNLIQNNLMILSLNGGLAGNSEKYKDSDSTWNLEAVVELVFMAFRYDDPEMDVDITLRIYPSLTDFGRVRVEFVSNIQYEILKDFYIGVGVFDNFDSRPPVVDNIIDDPIKNDFGIETTINWRFK